jgi:hypothetical protein
MTKSSLSEPAHFVILVLLGQDLDPWIVLKTRSRAGTSWDNKVRGFMGRLYGMTMSND